MKTKWKWHKTTPKEREGEREREIDRGKTIEMEAKLEKRIITRDQPKYQKYNQINS